MPVTEKREEKNLKIKLAKTAGFCFGVDRAMNMMDKLVSQREKVATLGPIIHNPQVIENLKNNGVSIIENPEEATDGQSIVIRTHGVTKDVFERSQKVADKIYNATCPYVQKIHKIVSNNSDENSVVLIAGDENHPEVVGIRSYCNGTSYVLKNSEELENLLKNNPEIAQKRVIMVAQTTFNTKEWQKNLKILHFLCTNAIIFDTICSATEERQKEAIELSKECQLMIIIGGRTSSNTAKLKAVCEENCQTVLIETADELNQYDLNGYDTVGVTAGASTPACIIKEVLETMSETVKEQNIPEVEATENTAEDASFEALLEESLNAMNSDQKVKGVVMGITPSEIQVDIGRKHAGYVPMDEYSNDPTADATKELKIGDEIDLIIMKTNDQEGTVMLSKRRFDSIGAWLKVVEAEETGEILEGVVTEVIRGGVLVASNGARVFVPASQATVSRNVELEDLLKTKVRFKVIEINKQRRRAVGSIKTVLIEERKAASEALWATLAEEQVYTGVVKSMTAYGAFVDIGGVDGMIHISELSWKRIKHPSEIVNVGDTVEVFIKALDREKKKISLGFKKAEDNPWEILRRDYPVDTVVDAKIVGITTFGAFAQIIPGIDGLIHISQIADRRIEKPADVLEVGEVVKAKITAIDFDKKRVSLSIRALIEPQEEAVEEATEEVVEETAEETTEE